MSILSTVKNKNSHTVQKCNLQQTQAWMQVRQSRLSPSRSLVCDTQTRPVDTQGYHLPDPGATPSPSAIYILDEHLRVQFHNGVTLLNESNRPLFIIGNGRMTGFDGVSFATDLAATIKELSSSEGDKATCIFVQLGKLHHYLPVCVRIEKLTNLDSHGYFIVEAYQLPISDSALIEKAATKYQLTDAERAVLALLIDGLPNKKIAVKRSVSPETIKKQILSIFAKTGCENRTVLARLVMSDNAQPLPRVALQPG